MFIKICKVPNFEHEEIENKVTSSKIIEITIEVISS